MYKCLCALFMSAAAGRSGNASKVASHASKSPHMHKVKRHGPATHTAHMQLRRGEDSSSGGGSAAATGEMEALRARAAGLEAAADSARERCCELQAELARQRKRCARDCHAPLSSWVLGA